MARGVQVGGRGGNTRLGLLGYCQRSNGSPGLEGVSRRGLGPVYGKALRSADGVSYVGDLNILAALVVAAQLKHQRPHMAAQLSLRHTAYDLCHPRGRGAEGQESRKPSGRAGGWGLRG